VLLGTPLENALGTPLGNALRTWGTSLGTCTRGFQIVMYRGALGCFEKGGDHQTLRLGWNEMDINITQTGNGWAFETQIKMWMIIYSSKMIDCVVHNLCENKVVVEWELYLTHHLTHGRQLVVELEEWYTAIYIIFMKCTRHSTHSTTTFMAIYPYCGGVDNFNCCNVGNGVVNM